MTNSSVMVTVDVVRRVARHLPRTTEHLIHDRAKFRVRHLVYVAFSRDEALMGFAFPKEERAARIWYFGDRFTGTHTYTNPETGRVFREVFSHTSRDQKITDNGDGTLTIQVQQTGPSRYYADGTLMFIDTGITRFSFLVDHGGTPSDPDDDEFIEDLGVDKVAGPRQTEGRDFCADLVEFIG